MTLTKLKAYRKPIRAGDLFHMRIPGRRWLWGRVVSVDALLGPMEHCTLMYLYNSVHANEDERPVLVPPRLLVPPILTNNRLFTMGYARVVENLPLEPEHLLKVHCFKPYGVGPAQYWNERNERLRKPFEPVGVYALDSFRTIDDAISEALDMPFAPD